MRAPFILACAVAAAAAPTEGTGPCGGAESIAEFDLYGKGWFHANTGCGADDTNGTVLEHFVGCEADVLYPPFPTEGNGPEKCQSLGRKDGGSFIATKVKHGCWVNLYKSERCGIANDAYDKTVGKCIIADPGVGLYQAVYSSWKITCKPPSTAN